MRANQQQLTEVEHQWARLTREYIEAKGGEVDEERLKSFVIRTTGYTFEANRILNSLYDNHILLRKDGKVYDFIKMLDTAIGEEDE